MGNFSYIYRATKAIQIIDHLNVDKDLEKVKHRIKFNRYRLAFIRTFQRVAAILVLPLLLTTLYFSSKEDYIGYLEVRTNPGMISQVTLPDSTRVWLNSNSSLKYPRKFSSKERKVELVGEAYFSVQKDKSKRFVVGTPYDLNVEVYGTEFNVEAYKKDARVTTSLVSGSVALTQSSTSSKVFMQPNDVMVYEAETNKILLNDQYVPTLTSWKDNSIILKDTQFKDVLNILSKRFNVEFRVKNDEFYDFAFTGTFTNQHLSSVLEYFKIASNIHYRFIQQNVTNQTIESTLVELY